MDNQEEYRPLQEGYIESLEALLDEGRLVMKIFQGEEITCCDEEDRHVELIEESTDGIWSIGMSDDHQDDGERLTDRDDSITLHGLQEWSKQMGKPSAEFLPACTELIP